MICKEEVPIYRLDDNSIECIEFIKALLEKDARKRPYIEEVINMKWVSESEALQDK